MVRSNLNVDAIDVVSKSVVEENALRCFSLP